MKYLPEWARVGVLAIDERHDEFCEIAARLKAAKSDDEFLEVFCELYSHTVSHFKAEESHTNLISYKIKDNKSQYKLNFKIEK